MSLVTLFLALASAAAAPEPALTLKPGKAMLTSAGPLAFGPDGILFVGDTMGATLWALDTADRTAAHGNINIDVKGIQEKLAAMLGTTADQIAINDAIVNPVSHKAYLSVSRGRGPDAIPVILRVDASGRIEELSMENIKHSKVALANAPSADAKDRPRSVLFQILEDLAGNSLSRAFEVRSSGQVARPISRAFEMLTFKIE